MYKNQLIYSLCSKRLLVYCLADYIITIEVFADYSLEFEAVIGTVTVQHYHWLYQGRESATASNGMLFVSVPAYYMSSNWSFADYV